MRGLARRGRALFRYVASSGVSGADRVNSVFMIVDFQDHWAQRNPETARRILETVEVARMRGMKILWIYALGTPGDRTFFNALPPEAVGDRSVKDIFAGSAGFDSRLYPAVDPMPEDFVAGKGPDEPDAFTNRYLEKFLQGSDCDYVTGFMHSYCIYHTAKSGAEAGLPIAVLSGLTADKKDKIEIGKRNFPEAGICLRPPYEFPVFVYF